MIKSLLVVSSLVLATASSFVYAQESKGPRYQIQAIERFSDGSKVFRAKVYDNETKKTLTTLISEDEVVMFSDGSLVLAPDFRLWDI